MDGGMTEYILRLHDLVSARKAYPPQSLRQGEQGTVHLRITIAADGALIDITAKDEDAPPRLKRAAIQAVRDAAPFPNPPPGNAGSPSIFSLGVTFALH